MILPFGQIYMRLHSLAKELERFSDIFYMISYKKQGAFSVFKRMGNASINWVEWGDIFVAAINLYFRYLAYIRG